jgi:putative MATE family efflux protein
METLADEQLTAVRPGDRPTSQPAKLSTDARRLLEGPVLPTLLRMAAPTVALMLLQALLAAGETAFVGRLGSEALAGVALSLPLIMLMTTLAAGAFGGGVASGVARALGAGRSDDASRVAGTALTLASLLGLFFTVVMLMVGRPFYAMLGAKGPALDFATKYSNIYFLGAIPSWISAAAASILRGGGNAMYPAVVNAIGSVITLAVSPLLIFGAGPFAGFGIAGAAGAIVAFNLVMTGVLLRSLRPTRCPAGPSIEALRPRWKYAFEILRISVPSAGSTIISNLTFITLTGLVAPFGVAATAGYGAGGRLEYLLIPIVFGVGSALVPLVAASEGAGDFARVRGFTRAGAGLGAGSCGLIGAAAAFFPGAWMGLFTNDPAVAGIGQAYLVRVGPAYAFLGLGLGLYFAAQGRGRTTEPLLAGLTRLIVAGAGGAMAVGVFGRGYEVLFTMMAGGLVLYGAVMVVVMRRELGLCPPRS